MVCNVKYTHKKQSMNTLCQIMKNVLATDILVYLTLAIDSQMTDRLTETFVVNYIS